MKPVCNVLLVLMAGIITISSCRKKEKDNPVAETPVDFGQGTGRCRLSAVTTHRFNSGSIGYLSLSYDSIGRLRNVVNINAPFLSFYGASTAFTYHGDTIFARHSGNFGTDTVVLNNRNEIAQLGKTEPLIFEYDAAYQLLALRHVNGSSADNYLWKNGDMVKDSNYSNNYTAYSYFDKPMQYAAPDMLLYYTFWGVPFYKTRHLEKQYISHYSSVDTNNISYTFDADGKVISDTLKSSEPFYSYYNTFEYECK